MKQKNKGYWVYSIIAIIIGMSLFAFFGYLIYDLVLKLSEKDFSNNTVVQALITLVITVFLGGYFSKWLERRNAKKLETSKIQNEIALTLVDLSSAMIHSPDDETIHRAIVKESSKVKLYFDDETLKVVNTFIEEKDKKMYYDALIDCLKKKIK